MSDETQKIPACPTDEQLERFVDGDTSEPDGTPLTNGRLAELQQHVTSCPHCSSRITAFRQNNDLLSAIAKAHSKDAAASMPDEGKRLAPGMSSVPGYQVLSEIYRGGQGIVYEAVQLATNRTVALKLLLKGAFATVRQRQRFEREIDLVAGLRHPGIVTVFDSGMTDDGCLYFSMEYIEGQPLDRYVEGLRGTEDNRRLMTRLLKLFSAICDAIGYAHQHGIIHRDLKPGNILIDKQGNPHILDFGLAKIIRLDSTTTNDTSVSMTGEFMGTLAYASPEQTKGDPSLIDVRTDVYSLGIILYEMLTGHSPYSVVGPMADVLRAIAEEAPAPPSSWHRRPSGELSSRSITAPKINNELETIVLKALAKEKHRRYQSVEQFRKDIEHFLAGEPIDAKRDSSWYVFQKAVRRHKAPVSVAAGFLLLIAGFLTTLVNRNKALAEEKETWKSMLLLQEHSLSRADPYEVAQVDPNVISMLDEQSALLGKKPPANPLVEAELRDLLGRAYRRHELYAKARPQLQISLDIRRRLLQPPDADLAQSMHDMAALYWQLGDFDAAEPLYRGAMEMRQQIFPGANADVAESLNHLAALLQRRGRFDEALDMYRRALNMRQTVFGAGSKQVAWSRNNLATCLRDAGRYAEAAETYRQSLNEHISLLGPDHMHVAYVETGLGRCLALLGDDAGAQNMLQQALTIKRKQPNPSPPSIAITLYYLAEAQRDMKQLAEAEKTCREALELQRQTLPARSDRTSDTLLLLGEVLKDQNKLSEAEPIFREAMENRAATKDFRLPDAQLAVARCLTATQRYDETERLLLTGYGAIKESSQQQQKIAFLRELVDLYQRWQKPERAAHYEQILAKSASPVEMSVPMRQ